MTSVVNAVTDKIFTSDPLSGPTTGLGLIVTLLVLGLLIEQEVVRALGADHAQDRTQEGRGGLVGAPLLITVAMLPLLLTFAATVVVRLLFLLRIA